MLATLTRIQRLSLRPILAPTLRFSADLLFATGRVLPRFSFTTLKPSVFIDTAMKENNPDWSKIHSDPCDITLKNEVGRSFDPKDLSGLGDAVAQCSMRLIAGRTRLKRFATT